MTSCVHLHVHSSYRLRDSTVRINDLVDATACALVAYQAAYLKAHYPAEYCSA